MNVLFEDEMTRNELFLHDDDLKPRAWFAFHLKNMPLFQIYFHQKVNQINLS